MSLAEEVARLRAQVADLQSGMYINCVYCGHRYGPKEDTPATMADVLKAHVEQCPAHPMSELKRRNEELERIINRGWAHTVEVARKSVVGGIFRRFRVDPRLATASSKDAAARLKDRIMRALKPHLATVDHLIRTDNGYDLSYAAAMLVSIAHDLGIDLADPRAPREGELEPTTEEARASWLVWPPRFEQFIESGPEKLGRAHLVSELEAEDGDEELLNEAANALIFCSGSYDFGPEGQAKEGWDKLCRPVLTKLLARLPVPESASDVDSVDTGPKT